MAGRIWPAIDYATGVRKRQNTKVSPTPGRTSWRGEAAFCRTVRFGRRGIINFVLARTLLTAFCASSVSGDVTAEWEFAAR